MFIHANSYTDIIEVEDVPLDKIDREQVQKGLTKYPNNVHLIRGNHEAADISALLDFELSALSAWVRGMEHGACLVSSLLI